MFGKLSHAKEVLEKNGAIEGLFFRLISVMPQAQQ